MKKLTKLTTVLGAAGVGFLARITPALASDLCPTGSMASVCQSNATPAGLIQTVVTVLMFIGFAAALIFLIISGIKWVTSGGDKAQTEAAKQGVTSALVGLVIVLASYILINVVLNLFGLGSVGSMTPPNIVNLLQ